MAARQKEARRDFAERERAIGLVDQHVANGVDDRGADVALIVDQPCARRCAPTSTSSARTSSLAPSVGDDALFARVDAVAGCGEPRAVQ